MSSCDSDKWNSIYASGDHGNIQAAKILQENTYLLPVEGTALDLACGLGANALLLARCGLETWAWDVSQTALDELQTRSRETKIPLQLEQRDVTIRPPASDSFDVIVISRFLDRALMPHLISALRENGLIYYQTFTREKTSDCGPKNPDFRLGCNELLHFFLDLQILVYREEGKIGDVNQGFRNQAMLIARKIR